MTNQPLLEKLDPEDLLPLPLLLFELPDEVATVNTGPDDWSLWVQTPSAR